MWIDRSLYHYFNGYPRLPWMAGSGIIPYWFLPRLGLGPRLPLHLCPCSLCWECIFSHSFRFGVGPHLLQEFAQMVPSLQACYHFMKNPISLLPASPVLLCSISPHLIQHLPCILLNYLGSCLPCGTDSSQWKRIWTIWAALALGQEQCSGRCMY